ncbi:MAG: DUF4321 domain-containing protein [Calditrichales bacterium]|nr:MAG: DUF4321 domain-containing protein [Calditrichales bacterium]
MRKKSIAFVIFIIVIGALIGTALGEVIGIIIPSGVVQDFFLKSASASIGPATLDIILLTLTIGFSFKLNITGVLGIIIAAYVLRWID